MFAWFKRFLNDEAYFSKLLLGARSMLMGIGLAATGGQIDLGPLGWWAGPIMVVLAGLMKQGEMNVPLLTQLEQLSPEDKVQFRALLK